MKMKRNIRHYASILIAAIAVMFTSSCDKVNSEHGDVPIDYREYFDTTFLFDNNGECYCNTTQPITRSQFESGVVGKGWKHVTTNEINSKGKMQLNDFYSNIFGLSPNHLYFNSSTDLTLYSFSDALNQYGFRKTSYEYNEEGNKVCSDTHPIRILSIEDDCTMLYVIESVGRVYDNDKFSNIYCLSIYKRMTDEELNAYKATYIKEF